MFCLCGINSARVSGCRTDGTWRETVALHIHMFSFQKANVQIHTEEGLLIERVTNKLQSSVWNWSFYIIKITELTDLSISSAHDDVITLE